MRNISVPANAIRLPLSTLVADPFVRAAFQRAERDLGDHLATLPDEPRTPLSGGQEASLQVHEEEFA